MSNLVSHSWLCLLRSSPKRNKTSACSAIHIQACSIYLCSGQESSADLKYCHLGKAAKLESARMRVKIQFIGPSSFSPPLTIYIFDYVQFCFELSYKQPIVIDSAITYFLCVFVITINNNNNVKISGSFHLQRDLGTFGLLIHMLLKCTHMVLLPSLHYQWEKPREKETCLKTVCQRKSTISWEIKTFASCYSCFADSGLVCNTSCGSS